MNQERQYLGVCDSCGRDVLRRRPVGKLEICMCNACRGIDPRTANERDVVGRFLNGLRR